MRPHHRPLVASSILIAHRGGRPAGHAVARPARHRRGHPAAAPGRQRRADARSSPWSRRCWPPPSSARSPSTRFLLLVGRVGQDVVLDVRERLYLHFQRLSTSFHERYTSGRVISRQTSDVEAIADLLGHGLINLITSALLVGGIGIALLLMDLPLALGEPGLVPDPVRDDARVPQPRRARLPGHARGRRPRDRPLRREPRRHPRRARLPARAPQPGDLRAPRRPLPARQQLVGPAGGHLRARRAAGRPPHHRARAVRRRRSGCSTAT